MGHDSLQRDPVLLRQKVQTVTQHSSKVELQNREENRKLKFFLDGAVGSASGKFVTAPADRLKILIQTQHPDFKNKGLWRKNDGLISGFRIIYQNEGIIKGFYKSNSIALVRHGCHGGIGFLVHDSLHVIKNEKEIFFLNNFTIGALAGIGATLFTHPIDSFRTQVAGKIDKNTSIKSYWHSLSGNSSTKITRLYKGLTAGLFGVAPYAALNFGLRDTFADILFRYPYTRQHLFEDVATTRQIPKWHGSFLLGWMAGCCTQLITYPLEILKRRKQINPTLSYREIVRNANIGNHKESLRMLYRGFSLNIIRHPFCNGIVWFIRDAMSKWQYL